MSLTLPTAPAGPAITAGELVTRKWAADRLRVSVETLKRWEKRRLLHGRLIGVKLIRYSASEVEALALGR